MQGKIGEKRIVAESKRKQAYSEDAHDGASIRDGLQIAVPEEQRPAGLEGYTTRQLYAEILGRFDEDPSRDGLLKTPERVEKAMQFLTRGYHQNPLAILRAALFDVDYDEMVIVKDIEMFSLCEHHMLPFFGKVHVAYIPDGKVVGLSKIPRLVDVFARRLQVQERMTRQIADTIQEAIAPQGVGVVIEARHLCMMMRGVEKQNSSTVTSAMAGVFLEQKTRAEFLSLVRERSQSSI
jgi:GTP cyclohydrolase I